MQKILKPDVLIFILLNVRFSFQFSQREFYFSDSGVLHQIAVHSVQWVLFIVSLTAKDCKSVISITHAF